MTKTIRVTALALAVALACPALAQTHGSPLRAAAIVPDPANVPVNSQRLAPLIQRFQADLASLQHVHDIQHGLRRQAALRELYSGWRQRLATLDTAGLGTEDRIDHALFLRELDHRVGQLDFDARRYVEAAPLLPQVDGLIAMMEARRALEDQDGRAAAQALERAREALAERLAAIRKNGAQAAPGIRPVVANRAAGIVKATRDSLKQWHDFYAGYDPDFTWWIGKPYAELDKVMEEYATVLRNQLAGASDPETIVGDPIGRDALVASLRYEMIPYSPEELLQLAERELAWCQAEMAKAAKELGYDDWRQALEHIKTRHVAPGEQTDLVKALAKEAVDFLEANQLVTIPELAKRDWRMNMLDPQAQLQAPFFLGGEDVWVAYPTADMPQDKKLMSLRGNNRHFSRAVVHHELIPGHHLQFFMNKRYQTQRQLFRTPFWTEGWALYWEFLLWDKGFAKTPEDRIGMLFWRSHRAARIQFSLGFHLGRMSPQQAIDLLVEKVGHERENAAAEVRRSFAGEYPPIYQAAYMLGGLQFYALHKELVDSGRMSDRQFHDAILQGGTMPVEMVRARLLDAPPKPGHVASWRFYDLDG